MSAKRKSTKAYPQASQLRFRALSIDILGYRCATWG